MALSDDSAADDDDVELPIDPDLAPDDADWLGVNASRRHAQHVQLAIVLAVGVGGVLGAVGRYAVSLGLPTKTGQFPWGTFVINLSGSLVLGFLLVLLVEQFPRGRLARPLIGTGIIGAYTTFSTFMVDAIELIRDGHAATAALYVAASIVLGLAVGYLGMTGARFAVRAERWLQEELS